MLPILESLTNGPTVASRKKGYGRAPSVLVLLPTRELATQVVSLDRTVSQDLYPSIELYFLQVIIFLINVLVLNFISSRLPSYHLIIFSFPSLSLYDYRCFQILKSMVEH